MNAFNVVRFRVKPGHEQAFVDAHRAIRFDAPGFIRASLIDTGNRSYCFIGEWMAFDNIVQARPKMIGLLDTMREHLEDLGTDLGLTDPVSGTCAVDIRP